MTNPTSQPCPVCGPVCYCNSCGNCRHWEMRGPDYIGTADGFGLCNKAPHYTHTGEEGEITTLFAVFDGEDYTAGLLTKENFYCAEWEKK